MTILLRVLVVEDSDDDAQLVLRQLRSGGYDLKWARMDTLEAMNSALDREQWDVIICDYRMPRFSAPEALKLIQEKKLDIPFIIVSGTIGEDLAVAAMKSGAHDYLMKDNLARLVVAVEREMREAKNRHEKKQAEFQINEKLAELQRWHNATLGRESRILGLKHEVNELLGKAGQPPRYPSAESQEKKEK